MFPSMDEHTALSFQLVKEYLQPLFPPETLKMVDPWFVMSGKALASRKGDAARWQEKVFVHPPGPSRVSPRIRNKVQEAIYHAVLHEQGLKIRYLPRGAKEPKSHLISPLGLVVRDRIVYLVANFVATQSKPENQLYLPLHRIQDASTEGAFRRPEGFNLREYAIERMGFPMGESKTINLVLRLDQRSAVGVSECPISERQSLEAAGDGFVLKAVVPNTLEIRQWIRSMGQCAEVLEPGFLREEFKEEAAALAKRYRRGNAN